MASATDMQCGTDCGELIKALEDCHAKGYMNKVLGNCNGIKHELNMCLREEVRGPLGIGPVEQRLLCPGLPLLTSRASHSGSCARRGIARRGDRAAPRRRASGRPLTMIAKALLVPVQPTCASAPSK